MKEFQLDIVTPSKPAFSGKVKSVTVPGTKGSFQILFNHAPIISSLEPGIIKIVGTDDIEKIYATSGGTVEAKNNIVLILAETFENPADIILERAMSARDRAKLRLKERRDVDISRAEGALARAMNRISVYNKYKITG